jgi:hypothetical protein
LDDFLRIADAFVFATVEEDEEMMESFLQGEFEPGLNARNEILAMELNSPLELLIGFASGSTSAAGITLYMRRIVELFNAINDAKLHAAITKTKISLVQELQKRVGPTFSDAELQSAARMLDSLETAQLVQPGAAAPGEPPAT